MKKGKDRFLASNMISTTDNGYNRTSKCDPKYSKPQIIEVCLVCNAKTNKWLSSILFLKAEIVFHCAWFVLFRREFRLELNSCKKVNIQNNVFYQHKTSCMILKLFLYLLSRFYNSTGDNVINVLEKTKLVLNSLMMHYFNSD